MAQSGVFSVSEGVFCGARAFQKRFLKGALADGVDVAALSLGRGNGESALAAHILERALTPGDDLYIAGSEYLLCAATSGRGRWRRTNRSRAWVVRRCFLCRHEEDRREVGTDRRVR